MRHLKQAAPVHPVHEEPAFQQRHVERGTVERAQDVEPFQPGCDMLQQERLLRIVAHQKLVHFKSVVRQETRTHEKGHGAASAQSRGLCIQVQDPPRIQFFRDLPVAHEPQCIRRQIQGVRKFLCRTVYREMAAVRTGFRGGCPAFPGPAHCPELILQVHFVSSFSRRTAVRLPSSPISPTGPTQEGHP